MVDHHEIIRVVLFCILQKLGFDADLATNVQEALKATQVNATDGRNEVNRKNPRISCAPPYFIAVSLNTSVRDKNHCLALGMIEYIEKPISFHKVKLLLVTLDKNIQALLLE